MPEARPPASSDAMSARFSAEIRQGVHIITFSRTDILDAHYIEQLGDDLARLVRSLDAPRLVVDLEKVSHLSSAALGMLTKLASAIEGQGGRFALASIPAEVYEVFKITKLHKRIDIYDNVAKAVASVA